MLEKYRSHPTLRQFAQVEGVSLPWLESKIPNPTLFQEMMSISRDIAQAAKNPETLSAFIGKIATPLVGGVNRGTDIMNGVVCITADKNPILRPIICKVAPWVEEEGENATQKINLAAVHQILPPQLLNRFDIVSPGTQNTIIDGLSHALRTNPQSRGQAFSQGIFDGLMNGLTNITTLNIGETAALRTLLASISKSQWAESKRTLYSIESEVNRLAVALSLLMNDLPVLGDSKSKNWHSVAEAMISEFSSKFDEQRLLSQTIGTVIGVATSQLLGGDIVGASTSIALGSIAIPVLNTTIPGWFNSFVERNIETKTQKEALSTDIARISLRNGQSPFEVLTKEWEAIEDRRDISATSKNRLYEWLLTLFPTAGATIASLLGSQSSTSNLFFSASIIMRTCTLMSDGLLNRQSKRRIAKKIRDEIVVSIDRAYEDPERRPLLDRPEIRIPTPEERLGDLVIHSIAVPTFSHKKQKRTVIDTTDGGIKLKSGEVIEIIGKQQSGKSTVVRSILGSHSGFNPSQTNIEWGGIQIGELGAKQKNSLFRRIPQEQLRGYDMTSVAAHFWSDDPNTLQWIGITKDELDRWTPLSRNMKIERKIIQFFKEKNILQDTDGINEEWFKEDGFKLSGSQQLYLNFGLALMRQTPICYIAEDPGNTLDSTKGKQLFEDLIASSLVGSPHRAIIIRNDDIVRPWVKQPWCVGCIDMALSEKQGFTYKKGEDAGGKSDINKFLFSIGIPDERLKRGDDGGLWERLREADPTEVTLAFLDLRRRNMNTDEAVINYENGNLFLATGSTPPTVTRAFILYWNERLSAKGNSKLSKTEIYDFSKDLTLLYNMAVYFLADIALKHNLKMAREEVARYLNNVLPGEIGGYSILKTDVRNYKGYLMSTIGDLVTWHLRTLQEDSILLH
jgi:ABC-type cobalamin/Fe3+-siderophores transport system ATPase subunit